MSFAKDSDGNWGYKVGGADPVIPFNYIEKTLLWTNPSSTLGAQTITLTNKYTDYDILYFQCKAGSEIGLVYTSQLLKTAMFFAYYPYDSNNQHGRIVARISDTQLYISNCDTWSKHDGSSETWNAMCVPLNIYGIKVKINI